MKTTAGGAKKTAPGTRESEPAKSSGIAPRANAKLQRDRMTRAEVARELGCVKSTVLQLQRREEIKAERIGGVDYFDRAEVMRVALNRTSKKGRPENGASSPAGVLGELAKRVFLLLDGGTAAVELVTKLAITPEAALKYVEQYNSLREVQVSRATAHRCARCNDAPARFCGGCATKPQPQAQS